MDEIKNRYNFYDQENNINNIIMFSGCNKIIEIDFLILIHRMLKMWLECFIDVHH